MNQYFTVEQFAIILSLLSAEAGVMFYLYNLYRQFNEVLSLVKLINRRSVAIYKKLGSIYDISIRQR